MYSAGPHAASVQFMWVPMSWTILRSVSVCRKTKSPSERGKAARVPGTPHQGSCCQRNEYKPWAIADGCAIEIDGHVVQIQWRLTNTHDKATVASLIARTMRLQWPARASCALGAESSTRRIRAAAKWDVPWRMWWSKEQLIYTEHLNLVLVLQESA